jgi:hemoglobin
VPPPEQITFYEAVGGEETFRRLVARFYQGVASDPLLRPLYPEEDLAAAEERLRMFLVQYWGGPTTYSQRRGHPALRMRHARFAIGQAQRDAWLRHMTEAVESLELPAPLGGMLIDYVTMASGALINQRG